MLGNLFLLLLEDVEVIGCYFWPLYNAIMPLMHAYISQDMYCSGFKALRHDS